jgi:hypothetical protein
MINRGNLDHWSSRVVRNSITKLCESELMEFCKATKDSIFKLIKLSYKTLKSIDYPFDFSSSHSFRAGNATDLSSSSEWFILALTPYPHLTKGPYL